MMESCVDRVRLPLQALLAEGCSLQLALQSSSCPGYVVDGTPSFLRLLRGLTQGSCVLGLPMVSFGCCICCLCQAVAAQEMDPCTGLHGRAQGCKAAWVLLCHMHCPWQHPDFAMRAGVPMAPTMEPSAKSGLGSPTLMT